MSEAPNPNPAAGTPNAGEGNPANPPAGTNEATPAPAGQSDPKLTNTATPPAESKPVVPDKYDLKIPDGAQLKPEQLEKIAQFAKEQGFSQEQAQKYLERENAVLTEYVNKQQEDFKAQTQSWVEQVKVDKELGGEKFQENMEHATRAFERFATPEFAKIIKESGFGNHPELVRTFFKIGQAMKEDRMVNPPAQGSSAGKSAADLLYGGTKP
jgi:hypothetical protein